MLDWNIDEADVTEQHILAYKQAQARLFVKRGSILGRRHSGTKYGLKDSSMRDRTNDYKEDPDTAEIMKEYPNAAELSRIGRAATKRMSADPNWLNTIE